MADSISEENLNGKFFLPFRYRGLISSQTSLAFDSKNNNLWVADYCNKKIWIFSVEDRSLIHEINEKDIDRKRLINPHGLVVDRRNNFIYVADGEYQISAWSMDDFSPVVLPEISSRKIHGIGYNTMAIDEKRNRIISIKSMMQVDVSSLEDFSHIFNIGIPGNFQYQYPESLWDPRGLAIDEENDLIYIVDRKYNSVLVFSLENGSYLRKIYGNYSSANGMFRHPRSICVINQGRFIVADTDACRLQAFTDKGRFISELLCSAGHDPLCVVFNPQTGCIVYSSSTNIFIISAGEWLPDTKPV